MRGFMVEKIVLLREMGRIARNAGDLLLSYFRRSIKISYKGVANLVTEADTASERFILDGLRDLLPEAGCLSEEDGGRLNRVGFTWVVDPLDGTTNFAHGFPWFCVSIALVENGHPMLGVIYHPVLSELFSVGHDRGAFRNGSPIHVSETNSLKDSLLTTGFYYHRGAELKRQVEIFERIHQVVQTIRRPGSAALDLAYIAAGYFDAFWEKGLAPWDVAAGYLLVREAGGIVTDFGGKKASIMGDETVASNGLLHAPLIEIISRDAS